MHKENIGSSKNFDEEEFCKYNTLKRFHGNITSKESFKRNISFSKKLFKTTALSKIPLVNILVTIKTNLNPEL